MYEKYLMCLCDDAIEKFYDDNWLYPDYDLPYDYKIECINPTGDRPVFTFSCLVDRADTGKTEIFEGVIYTTGVELTCRKCDNQIIYLD